MRKPTYRLRRTTFICMCLVPAMAMAQQRNSNSNSHRNDKDKPARESKADTQDVGTLTPAEFAYDAAWINLKAMRLGQIAVDKTTDSEIRQFAQKMVSDHAGANNRLTQLAGNKGYRLPNTNILHQTQNQNQNRRGNGRNDVDQANRGKGHDAARADREEESNDLREIRRIQGLSGTEFDRAFLNEVVDSHEEAVSAFENATETVMDEQVKQFAKDALPILEDHLNKAQQLVSSKGYDVGRGVGAAANETVSSPANFAYQAVLMSLKEIRASEMALHKTGDSSVKEFAQQMIAAHGGMNNRLLQLSRNKGYEVPSTNLFASVRTQGGSDQGEKARQGSGARKQTEKTRPESDYDSDRDYSNNRDGNRRVNRDVDGDAYAADNQRQNEVRALQRLQGLSGDRFDRAYITEMVRDHTKAVRKFQAASESIADEQVKLFAKDALPIIQDHLSHAQRLAREKGLNVGRGLGAVEIQR